MLEDGFRIADNDQFLKVVVSVFEPVLDEKGKALLPQVVKKFENHETEHLNLSRLHKNAAFDKTSGNFYVDPFGPQADFLYHETESSKNRILTSTHRIASRADLQKAPKTQNVKTLLAWLDKYKQRGHEEFPVVAQELIDGKPASIRR